MVLAGLSTIVEWCDFTLYLYFSTVLARVFFGTGPQSLTETLGGFAIAFLMRPVGALVFGHFGDRFGRRITMLSSMASMTGAMLATAMLPTYAQIGSLAGVLLIVLRCLPTVGLLDKIGCKLPLVGAKTVGFPNPPEILRNKHLQAQSRCATPSPLMLTQGCFRRS